MQEASSQAADLVRTLGKDISNMKRSLKTTLIKRLHSSTERLQRSIDLHSYLLTCNCDLIVDNSSKPLTSKLTHALSSTLYSLSEEMNELDSKNMEKNSDPQAQNLPSLGALPPVQTESYHEMMRKQSRRLYSWPSREVDAFEEDGGINADFLPRMRALDSTAALSLANFTSSLIEFVARLDHLVEEVDKLSKMAKFKHEGL
ncbi:Aluminum-activated malate transporter 9 [Quillaja saponaria]|uniref:Aluminum-activated malate transporter 9 n=1 Tax=Quillaja saponaria TaxID=32244 RepID=A0AAD7L7B8_QUISA|nr:Aluminum-activated malate transporter 9 [Quillaja saponaria]